MWIADKSQLQFAIARNILLWQALYLFACSNEWPFECAVGRWRGPKWPLALDTMQCRRTRPPSPVRHLSLNVNWAHILRCGKQNNTVSRLSFDIGTDLGDQHEVATRRKATDVIPTRIDGNLILVKDNTEKLAWHWHAATRQAAMKPLCHLTRHWL